MALTAAQARAKKRRHTETARIILDPAWGRKLGEAQLRLERLRRDAEAAPSNTSLLDEMTAVGEEVEELMAQADDEILTVEFVGLSGDRYDRLVRAHLPTKEQRTRAAAEGRSVAFNEDTFPRALVTACWRSPRAGWSDKDIAELFEAGEEGHEEDDDAPAGARWNSAELSALFYAATAACASRHQA